MSPVILSTVAFVTIIALIFIGCPIFIALGFIGLLGIYLISGIPGLSQAPQVMFGSVFSFPLVAAPLFIIMGETIFRAGIGGDLYEAFSRWMNRVPGGLAMATIIANVIFGAMCGVSIVAVVTIGLMAIPEMLKRGYDKGLAAGSVCAAGAISMLIPPSLLLILYGTVASVSVAKLFAGGILPGIVMGLAMIIYVLIRVSKNPSLAPRPVETITWGMRFKPMAKLWPALILILAVLGTIYSGICTPTESGAIGALVALLLARFYYHKLPWKTFQDIFTASGRSIGSLICLVGGAMLFTTFLNTLRFPEWVADTVVAAGLTPWSFIIVIMLLLVVLGCFIDGASMVLVTTPILLPSLIVMGFDPLWYGVVLVANINIAVITPPVGLNLYALGSVTKDVSMTDILKGTLPYVVVEFACLAIFIALPQIVTFIPSTMG